MLLDGCSGDDNINFVLCVVNIFVNRIILWMMIIVRMLYELLAYCLSDGKHFQLTPV